MKLKVGGALSFYTPAHARLVEVKLDKSTQLTDVLYKIGIPVGEVYIVSVNGELADLNEAFISPDDEVSVYSAVDGG